MKRGENRRSRPWRLTCKLLLAGSCRRRLHHAAKSAAVCAAVAPAGGPAAWPLAAGRLPHTAAAAALHVAVATAASPPTARPMAIRRLHHDATAAVLCATAASAGKATARPLAAGRLQHRRKLARHRAPFRSAAGGRQHGPRLPGGARPPQQQRQNWIQLRPRQPEGPPAPLLPAQHHGTAVTCCLHVHFGVVNRFRWARTPVRDVPSVQLQGALAAVLHEDDSEEGQETQQTRAAANRMRQHNRSAQRRYREKQRVCAESTFSTMAAASAESHCSTADTSVHLQDCGHDGLRYCCCGVGQKE